MTPFLDADKPMPACIMAELLNTSASDTTRKRLKRTCCIFLIAWTTISMAYAANGNRATDFVEAARSQIGRTIIYDPSYRALDYPNGDIPIERGVCTDVVIRAMRTAYRLDLQKLVHEDMSEHFAEYPQRWSLKHPDENIDHRRVPNLEVFMTRRGWSIKVSKKAADYRPGDIVTCIVPPHLPHIMIVSDKKNHLGIPLIIHNIGAGVQEEDRLFEFKLTGHYRISAMHP